MFPYLRLLPVLLSVVLLCLPAKGELKWLDKEYQFGLMKETAGIREGSASFVNVGPGPTYIRNVRTSCGCTKAVFPEGLIEEGDTVTIKFSYNPEGRPGPFAKTIKVFVGEDNKMHVVKIFGTVIGSPETLAATYPYESGPLRFSDRIIAGGDVTYGELKHFFVSMTNQSTDTIHPAVSVTQKPLRAAITPELIPPGELATLAISFNSGDEFDMGNHDYPITLISDTDSRFPEETELSLKVNLKPDLLALNGESLETAPQISVIPPVIEANRHKSSNPLSVRFTIRNLGKSTLIIKRISSPGIKVTPKRYPTRLEPGKKGEAEVSIPASALGDGIFRLPVEISSNDPLHPVVEVRVTGDNH